MNTRWFGLLSLPLAGVLFQFCNEPFLPQGYEPPPVAPGPTPVHLAVGNSYNRQVTRVGAGTFFQWYESSTITDDTTLNRKVHYIFDSGEILRSSGDTVFAYSHDSTSVYYRLDVAVGDVVPFIGYQFRVTAVDTQEVLGETQIVITVSNEFVASTDVVSGRYASKFGLIRIERRDSLSATTSSLWGARLGTTIYGSIP